MPSQIKYLGGPPRLENTLGTGFDPMLAGPNGTNIPQEAIVVFNTDTNVRPANTSLWKFSSDIARYHSPQGSLFTTTNGASLSYKFDGVAIW
jgi:hypothetical protein